MKGLTFDLQRFAEYTFTYNAEATDGNKYILNGTGYATPTDAFNTLSDGDTVKLENDVEHTISDNVLIQGANLVTDGRGVVTRYDPRTITLDLNGHKWTRTAKGSSVFFIASGGNLIIDDSSEAQTGAIVVDENVTAEAKSSAKVITILTGGSCTLNGGSLINNGKNVNGNTNEIFGVQLNGASNATFTMNGGSISVPYEASDTGKAIRYIGVIDSSSITINGGTITSAGYGIDANANLVVNGGTIETTGDKAAILSRTSVKATVKINGGTIKSAQGAAVTFDAANGSLEISGGTFTGDITADESATINADEYSVTRTLIVKVDGVATRYTTDQWANVKDTLKEISLNSEAAYYTADGWASAESTLVKATFDGETFYFTTTPSMSTAASEGGYTKYHLTVDDDPNTYFSTDGWAAVKDTLTKITLNGATVYYTADKWATVEGTLYKAYLDDKLYYYSIEAKRTSAIKNYKFTAVIDGETRNYKTEAKKQATLDKCTTVEIDGEVSYYSTDEKAQAALDNAFAATIDGTTSYYSTEQKMQAAVAGKTAVTVDGVTKYFTTQALAAAAVKDLNAVTIDGTTSYYTDAQDAASAVENCAATVTVGDETTYFTTLAKAANSVDGKTATINLLKDETGAGIMFSNAATNVTIDFGKHKYTVGNPAVGSQGTESQAFHFDKGATVTLKNGTITSSAESSSVAMLVQNYCNLTVEDMTLDGSNLADAYYGSVKPENLGACVTLSINNGTVNIKGDTDIIARKDADRSHYAMDVCASKYYPDGAHVTVDTTGTITNVLVDGKKTGSDGKFVGDLTINGGTVGEIRVDSDAVGVNAQDKISIKGGTLANGNLVNASAYLVMQSDPLFEVFEDGYVLVAEGWNSVSDSFVYVKVPPESGNVGTKLITVGNVTSTNQIKFDSEQQIFAVPTTAKISGLATGYKTVKVAYDANSTTATVSTDEDAIEITEKLLADTVTKISASGNANTVYISGDDKFNSIVGGKGDDTLAGTNITLTGGDGADIFVAGEKITITDYGTGSDKISVGADAGIPDIKVNGKNLLLTFDDGKTVNLLNAADKVVTVTNEDGDSYYSKDGQTSGDGLSVTLPASTKTYTVKAPIKDVDGSKTSGVNITGNALDNVLTGGAGNDKLFGNAGTDTLKASAGTDTLNGGKGDDVFVQGAGNAIITDYSTSGSNGADKISLDASPTSFKFSGSNLVLTFDDERTLTVNGAKNKALTFTNGDGSTVRTYIDNGAVSEDGKITLDENFKGAGQNISKVNDVTQIDASTATRNLNLVGNNKGNTLKGGSGNDTLTGGTTAADEYTGNAGADVFVYNGGEDTITDYAAEDTLKLTKNFSIKSAAFGNTDVVFTLNAAGNVVTLTGAADKTITVKDGSNQLWTYNKDFTSHGNGVTLQASANEFDASDGAWKNLVTLDGSAASTVKLTGNAKNNVFVGSEGADTFVYSAGNDTVNNLDGSDTVQVTDISSITAAKFSGSKTVVTVGRGSLTFKGNTDEINLVDAQSNSATLTEAGIVTEGGIQLFNGTKTYAGTADNVDASNVKNAVTLAGGTKAQTFTGAAGRTVYTFDGTGTMTIENYAAGDKVSVNGSVTNFEVADNNVTLTVGEGSIVLKDAADKLITLHDDANKAGQFTARAYLQTGVTADKVATTAVTLAADVGTYAAPQTVRQITYTGGEVTIKNFDTTRGKINHGELTITDVSETALAFGTGNTLTIGDLESDTKVQLTGKAGSSTVYLGEHTLTDTTGTKVSVTGGSEFVAGDKVNSVTALGSEKLSITGNALNNTLTANNAGNTLDGKAGTDVLIGGTGADIFIHDKITGTTTINGYTSTDSISLGEELSIVGSAYSPSSKNGTLTLTVEGVDDSGTKPKTVTSKIVIKSDDFTKAGAPTSGTVTINNTSTSFGKNAIYSDDKVKLLPTYSGKFTASTGAQVDGSEVTKSLTLQGTTGNETLTGGAYKTTLTGGKGDDSLHGGKGADVFTYAKGDGKDVIADFTYNDDKLKVSTGKLISDISVEQGNLTFDMTDGGSITIEDLEGDFVIKANSKLYWFDGGDLVTAKTNTADMTKIINDKTGSYAVVNLDYSTNLVTAELATASDQSAAFNAETYKKTT